MRNLALLLAALCSALAGTITGAGPTAGLRPLGVATTDHLVRNWWCHRDQGDTRERLSGNVESVSVPEPETWAMVAAGAALICAARIRRKASRRI